METLDTLSPLTQIEAAQYLGVSRTSILCYVKAGRLSPCPGTKTPSSAGRFLPSDLEKLRGIKSSYHGRFKRIGEAIRLSGRRTCVTCRKSLPLETFGPCPTSNMGIRTVCRSCEWQKTRHARYLRRLIADAKRSPLNRRHGFSVTINREGEYRAARLDKPLLPGERALTCYEFHNAEWGVYPPIILVAGSREMTDWCERYEMRQKQKAQVV